MQIGFQFLGAFERDGIVHAAPKKEGVFFARKSLGPRDQMRLQREHAVQCNGQMAQLLAVGIFGGRRNARTHFAQRDRQYKERGQLGSESFGRCNADFGARAGQNESAVCRTIALVATLQIASDCACPSACAYLSAASVSAVSPDCEMATTSVSGCGTGLR